jgi:uncharacterized protein YjiS (DUF1127 family)
MDSVQNILAASRGRRAQPSLALVNRAIAWFRLRSCISQLHMLPDHLLRDIGISRSEIDFVISHGRRRGDGIAGF